MSSVEINITLNIQLTVIYADQSAIEVFGCRHDIILGNSIDLLFRLRGHRFPHTADELLKNATFPLLFEFVPNKSNGYKVELKREYAGEEGVKYYLKFIALQVPESDSSIILPGNVASLISSVNGLTDLTMLHQIVNALPGKAHYKSADGFRYQIVNQKTLELVGIKHMREMIEMDDYKLAKHMGWRWPSKFAQELQEFDHQVVTDHLPLIGMREKPYLDSEGQVVKHSLTKIPLFDAEKNNLGVLTFAIDMVQLYSVSALRRMYAELYTKKKQGFHSFLNHIGLTSFCNKEAAELPTSKEFDVLIACSKGMTAKSAAKQLNIAPRTFDKYIEILKYKFNCHSKSELATLYNGIIDQFLSNQVVDI